MSRTLKQRLSDCPLLTAIFGFYTKSVLRKVLKGANKVVL